MGSERLKNEWVFLLVLGGKLPPNFGTFAAEFSKLNVTLVPIQFDQLVQFFKGQNQIHLMTIVTDLAERKSFDEYLKIRLAFAVKGKLITVHHLTSFGAIDFGPQYSKIPNYFHYSLPLKIDETSSQIVAKYRQMRDNEEKWPGGKRGRLPASPAR